MLVDLLRLTPENKQLMLTDIQKLLMETQEGVGEVVIKLIDILEQYQAEVPALPAEPGKDIQG